MSKKKILICEDDRGILDVVKLILENEGYIVFQADRKDSMYQLIPQHKPDTILLDIWISGHDGAEITKELKSQEATSHIPIVLMSANSQTEKIAKSSGADDFLLKPFNIEELVSIVRRYAGA